jgi:hypothetical protein
MITLAILKILCSSARHIVGLHADMLLYLLKYHTRVLIGNFGVRGKESIAFGELENISHQPQLICNSESEA